MSALQPLPPPSLLALLAMPAAQAGACAPSDATNEAFKREGINTRAKRLYLEIGDALIKPLAPHLSRLDKQLARREAVAFLRLIQAGEMDVPPPWELVEALGLLRLPQPAIEKVPAYLFRALWKECAQRLYQRQPLGDWLRTDAIPLIEWFVLTGQDHSMDANRRKAGWTSFARLREEWACESACADGTRSWPAVMKRFESGPFVITELNHERELHAEGVAMDHCVATWVGECLIEGIHLFSVRARRDGARLATMAIAPSGTGWEIIELKGPDNSKVSALINEFAAVFQSLLNDFAPRTETSQACQNSHDERRLV